jgi:hypothetical protein
MTDLLTRIERGEPVEAQEIFDFAVGKLIEQGVESVNEYHQSVYRAKNGNKCTFGHLIPDSLYRDSFEDRTAVAILREGGTGYSSKLAASLNQHEELITDLQNAHDEQARTGICFPVHFRHRAEAVAKEHGLTFKF